MTNKITHITYSIPSDETRFSQAIKKVLTQLPKSAPDTVVTLKEDEVQFDLRYMAPMLWQYTRIQMRDLGAKELDSWSCR
jgi:hypothetical protein